MNKNVYKKLKRRVCFYYDIVKIANALENGQYRIPITSSWKIKFVFKKRANFKS